MRTFIAGNSPREHVVVKADSAASAIQLGKAECEAKGYRYSDSFFEEVFPRTRPVYDSTYSWREDREDQRQMDQADFD